MNVQVGKKAYEWAKRGKRWTGPCLISSGCKGKMVINRGNLIARCATCGKHKLVEISR